MPQFELGRFWIKLKLANPLIRILYRRYMPSQSRYVNNFKFLRPPIVQSTIRTTLSAWIKISVGNDDPFILPQLCSGFVRFCRRWGCWFVVECDFELKYHQRKNIVRYYCFSLNIKIVEFKHVPFRVDMQHMQLQLMILCFLFDLALKPFLVTQVVVVMRRYSPAYYSPPRRGYDGRGRLLDVVMVVDARDLALEVYWQGN